MKKLILLIALLLVALGLRDSTFLRVEKQKEVGFKTGGVNFKSGAELAAAV